MPDFSTILEISCVSEDLQVHWYVTAIILNTFSSYRFFKCTSIDFLRLNYSSFILTQFINKYIL